MIIILWLLVLKEVHSVVMVEKELGSISQMYLSHPIWTRRITVLIGTPLRLADLRRARASNAMACFIHTYRGGNHDDAVRYTTLHAYVNLWVGFKLV